MRISDYRHRVALCSAYDEAATVDRVLLKRQKIVEAWARIDPVRGSFFMNQFAEREGRENHSHLIFVRWGPNLDISGYAWLFEQRALSGGRWYKVLSVREEDDRARYWRMECRLVEKGDTVAPSKAKPDASSPFAPLPVTGRLP